MAQQGSTNIDSILGRLVVEKNLCTNLEVQECLDDMKKLTGKGKPMSLADLLTKKGFVTPRQIDRARKMVEESRPSHSIPGFQILGKLGAGAMATVFKARQLSLDRIVAIKVLPKRLSENPEYVERFYKEGKAAAKLSHNNIVQAIDVGESGGYHYFVMEYVEGKTVYDDLSNGQPYPEPIALKIAIQIAHALLHAHEKGLIHRDVKPKNVMITNAGVAKLADMGLAREAADEAAAQMEAGRAYGTPYYISPEQIRGEMNIDYRADIYSLGATLYHMVTGRVPFEAPTPSAVMHKHLKDPLTPPDHINPNISVGLAEVIEVMMAKNREERYANCALLLEDLDAVGRGEPPLQAHKQFDAGVLSNLEEGQQQVMEDNTTTVEVSPTQLWWKMATIIFAGGFFICLLIIYMILSNRPPA